MNISEFLDYLADADDRTLLEFELHPKRLMDEQDVSPEDQALILGGDLSELRAKIQQETGSMQVYLIKMRP